MVRGTSPQGAIVQRTIGRCVPRNRDVKMKLGMRRRNWGSNGSSIRSVRGRMSKFPPNSWGRQSESWLIWVGRSAPEGKQVRQAGHMQFQVKSNIDWFELHARVDFDGRTIPFPELLCPVAAIPPYG